VRRLIAALLVLAFVAATAAPAIAACPRGPQEDCCCDPPPSNSLCAPDCCGTWKPAQPIVNVTAQLKQLAVVAPALVSSIGLVDLAFSGHPLPTAHWFVGIHARAAPRLPLRV